jgi:hypothetical protein
MEAARTSETSVNLIQATQRSILEDSHLRTGCENLKYIVWEVNHVVLTLVRCKPFATVHFAHCVEPSYW